MDEQPRNRRSAMRTARRSLIGAGVAALVLAAGAAWALRDDGPRRCPTGEDTVTTTPYPTLRTPADRVQGATLDVSATDGDLPGLLRAMRDGHRINTVTVYGLERWPAARLTALFTALRDLDMQVAPRLEWYDQPAFAFRPADARTVLDAHRDLLARVAAEPDRVAYVMLNMPVDDPQVQRRLGGVNSAASRDRQVAYATELVAAVRGAVGGGTRVFLGLFYGWDGAYDVPSYRPSRPDGYVLTNYSYPADDDIIGTKRLTAVADRAAREAGDLPIVVEYGFHTLTYQNGNMPDQIAGLVADPATKKKALRATTQFYCERYPAVIGTMYFGYNTYKSEGTPPRRLDFGLVAE